MITGAIICSLSENSAELNWKGAKMGTGDSARTHTTVIYSPFIMSRDVFCFLTRQANQKQFLSYTLTPAAGKPRSGFPRCVSFSSYASMVIVAVYHSEGHVPKMNSVLGRKRKKSIQEDIHCRHDLLVQCSYSDNVIRLQQVIVGV